MPLWTALILALSWAAGPAAAAEPPAFSLVILQETRLTDHQTGAVVGRARPYEALHFLDRRGDFFLALWPSPEGRPRQVLLPAALAAKVWGPPDKHHKRLERIRRVDFPPGLKRRLMSGRIQECDGMLPVEMAWGRPQRSFMVNYVADEQHFVYLGQGVKPLLLRFVGGALKPPLPAATLAEAWRVESPTSPR
ncbi:hypothetical protein AAU61_04460 [Desulfocarbo indianensis]|nr:hypothetical protein AAU61_04460 [Desulfocarbo indianensis]